MLEARVLLTGLWAQRFKILPSAPLPYGWFGNSVALSATTAVVGQSNSAPTSISFIDIETGELNRRVEIGSQSGFGSAIAIYGEQALVGEQYMSRAYLVEPVSGEPWHIYLHPPVSGRFAFSVATSGDSGLFGAPFELVNNVSTGAVFVASLTSNIGYRRLAASDGGSNDAFGVRIATFGSVVAIGAPLDDDRGTDSGSVYLFDINTGQQLRKFTAPDGAAGDNFGISVAYNGSVLVVGAYKDDDRGLNSGSAYILDANTGQLIRKLTASDGVAGDSFGAQVALDGDHLLVGSMYDDDRGTDSGSAYFYRMSNGIEIEKLVPSATNTQGHFGSTIAINGNNAIIGSPESTTGGLGSAYLFRLNTAAPTVTSSSFGFEHAQEVSFSFSKNVALSLDASDLQLLPASGGTPISASSVTYAAGDVATFHFSTRIPDGDYIAHVEASAVQDGLGAILASDASLRFHVLAGDLNRDRAVNFDDLLILAQNYGQTGKTFSQGNIDYSADGLVGFDDLQLLAQVYGSLLLPGTNRPRMPKTRGLAGAILE